MDTINYFVAETDLPQQDSSKSYGPIGTSQYRVTSVFNGENDIMAYAVTAGVVFIVDQDENSDRVNLILAPEGLPYGPAVKYFVYRGLKKSDFLDENNSYQTIRPADSEDSTFIKNLRKGQDAEQALSLYDDLTDDTFIDDLFLLDQYQFGLVSQGDSIGRFDSQHDYGFEIMLEETYFAPTLGIARLAVNELDIAALTDDAGVSGLQILNYIDPAAYYGLFAHSAYSVGTNNISSPTSRAKDGVYEFIKQFGTKNTVYIDIRDLYENPIDWFETGPQTIKLTADGTSAAGASEVSYRQNDQLPISILSSGFSNSSATDSGQKYFTLTLSLPITDNATPLLVLHTGYWLKFASDITDDMIVSICSTNNPDWSDDKTFTIFAADDNSSDIQIATYLRLHLDNYIDINAINNQIPAADGTIDGTVIATDLTGAFAFHMSGLPEYQAPTN